MKSYFVTMGFNETFLLRLLNETSAQKEDNLVIIVPSPIISGTRTAIDSLRAQTSRLNYPFPRVYEIDITDFNSALSKILDILLPLSEPIISDLTMGMRMINTLLLLGIIVSRKKFTIYVRDEGGGSKVISFSDKAITALMRDYSREEMKLLNLLYETKGAGVTELAKMLDKSEKTLINKIAELKKFGILIQKGKDRKVELNELGLNIIKLNRSVVNSVKSSEQLIEEGERS
ncbi:CRISPR locus-associated DNA-binding protein Csa3 [Saccharolobus shibatae B12]|uniref:CRISPR locus-associated DNA-binding protein Csa3 n=1 Tax=Saccharolobus shibatae (strain ATCC 51178 / DSM 5389 / JCM 8931 / NBRC 15437 / B12) TaxID=523848 RepID=A0A8F5BPA8_SACSH|nr:CRISPR-associated CARF protein Csa3 [Saccharolobus shibatae]QXJ28855.1 CRISPR locus-associated DNA-binding protein Csa3 [Saccharolobus shibatae B12]